MQIDHEHPGILDQEQYDEELRRIFVACIRKLRQTEGLCLSAKGRISANEPHK